MSDTELEKYYGNREKAILAFNKMILEEAGRQDVPLLERLKFLSILSGNLDEFFMIRISGLCSVMLEEQVSAIHSKKNGQGIHKELLNELYQEVHEIHAKQYACLLNEIFPALENYGVKILKPDAWSAEIYQYLETLFINEIAPLLTPIAVFENTSNIFTAIGNLSIHAAFWFKEEESSSRENSEPVPSLVFIQFPKNCKRFYKIPNFQHAFVLLDDIILTFCASLYPGREIADKILFKITRDADISVDEFNDDDFVSAMEDVLINRQLSLPLRMTCNGSSIRLINYVAQIFNLHEQEIFRFEGPLDLKGFMYLYDAVNLEQLKFPALKQASFPYEAEELWDSAKRDDILLQFPYDSFATIEKLFELAAKDPDVLAIKTTLYRVAPDSSIVRSLTRAARAGKQVTAVVELKARFDEALNIHWASKLEQAGAIVVYGVMHYKIHAKTCLIIRRERDNAIKRYAYIATGNFNEITAKTYVDIGLLTTHNGICQDVSSFFNVLTGLSTKKSFTHLVMAPFLLRSKIEELIEREIAKSTPEQPGLIVAKLNALNDYAIIQALYRASQHGVHIKLFVRGICQLIPGIPGLSETIEVRSLVGRFLEHSRIYYFRNGGNEDLYLSSADWMERNFDKRIELMIPVQSQQAKDKVKTILMLYFKDTKQARILGSDMEWHSVSNSDKQFSVQEYFTHIAALQHAKDFNQPALIPRKKKYSKRRR